MATETTATATWDDYLRARQMREDARVARVWAHLRHLGRGWL